MGKWITFARERFKPAEYLPLIVLFVGSNYLFSRALSGLELPLPRLLLLLVLGLCFFFRMRLFDEIKDYEVDLEINPTRPLARGLLKVPEVKRGILFLILGELALALTLGTIPFLVYLGAVFYSLLMYEEFFIGDWLRPHLTTYAVSHTVVVALLALALISANLGFLIFESKASVVFVLSHWFVFNLFEFARKTFDPEEERANVPSYSKIFGLRGAYLLSASQVFLSLLLLFQLRQLFVTRVLLGAAAIYVLLLVPCVLRKGKFNAGFFRKASTAYLAAHFIILFIALWRS